MPILFRQGKRENVLGLRFAVAILLPLCFSTNREAHPQDPNSSAQGAPEKPARKPVKLPGIEIDVKKRCVDLEATVCLDEGYLELVACTKGSKEHESIVTVTARPMHIHTALLLIGANNGNPATRKQLGETEKRWVHLPPSGDPIEVYLVFKNANDNTIQRPIRDFVMRSDLVRGNSRTNRPQSDKARKDNNFPKAFLFSGSQLRDDGNGPRQYLADVSGHVISIATFGDELLCLSGIQSHANGKLTWRVNPEHLPKVGTQVTLRLCLQKDAANGAKN